MLPVAVTAIAAQAQDASDVQRLVSREIKTIVPHNRTGGAAVAVRIKAQTLFFNYGMADADKNRPVTSDSLFNLASVGKTFDATLLALAVRRGQINLDDPIVNNLPELQSGGDARR